MNQPVPLPESHVFMHEAMHTTFCLRLIGGDAQLVAGAARECLDLVDELEANLSRFIDGSEVFRINRLHAGETLFLSDSCHQCLLLAMQAHTLTSGLFDITAGRRIAHRKTGASGPAPALSGKLVIHPDVAAITCESPGREIDLGGIAKGFALDQMAGLLADWGVTGGLLAAGDSSLLAIGPQAWPVRLGGELEARLLALTNQSLSASGTAEQGSHIIHPDDGDGHQIYLSKRVWAVAHSATMAEAWSTALMLMNREDVAIVIAQQESLLHAYAEFDGRVAELKSR